MTEEDRLWKGVLDAPEDDPPRLVYADWLEEHGEASRAEFIRAQVEMAGLDELDLRYTDALARARRSAAFATARGVPWRDQIPGAQVTFRRGAIASVHVPTTGYLRHPIKLWRSVPLEELSLWTGGRDRSKALAARPELSRVRRLALVGGWLSSQARTMLLAPSLSGARDLYLAEGPHIETGEVVPAHELEELAGAAGRLPLEGLRWDYAPPEDWSAFVLNLPRPLHRLVLMTGSGAELPDGAEGPERLVGSRHWPALRRLSLFHDINSIGWSTIYNTPPLPDLAGNFTTLPAEDLRLARRNVPELASLPSWGNLRTLRLSHDSLTDDLAPLAGARQAAGLRRLILDHPDGPEPRVGEAQPDVLNSRHLADLRHLRIQGYGLHSEEDFEALANAPFREGLVRLELKGYEYYGGINAAQVARLLSRPWPRLHTLSLEVADDPSTFEQLLTTPHLPELSTLLINDLTKARCAELARAPGLPRLSLCVSGEDEWLLTGGAARKVAKGVRLLDRGLYD